MIVVATIDRFMRMSLHNGYRYDATLRKAFEAAIQHGISVERERCADLVRNHPGNAKKATLLKRIENGR